MYLPNKGVEKRDRFISECKKDPQKFYSPNPIPSGLLQIYHAKE